MQFSCALEKMLRIANVIDSLMTMRDEIVESSDACISEKVGVGRARLFAHL